MIAGGQRQKNSVAFDDQSDQNADHMGRDSNELIDIRCNQCNNFLFAAAASAESDVTVEIMCRRCKANKNPHAKRVIRLPFQSGQQKSVASGLNSR